MICYYGFLEIGVSTSAVPIMEKKRFSVTERAVYEFPCLRSRSGKVASEVNMCRNKISSFGCCLQLIETEKDSICN